MKAKRLSKKAKRSSKKAKQLSLDIITTLPQPIIETILCLLPIKEAARTSILSREWRYKWTKIPKLVFSLPRRRQMMETSKLLCAIHQVMSLRQDPIHEFTLCLNDEKLFFKFDYVSCKLDQIIFKMSRNHAVKKLTLDFYFGYNKYDLPLSFFSLHHLTELYLGQCGLDHQPIFNGFGSLTSLTLNDVMISIKTLLHLLSNCPSLKSLGLLNSGYNILGHEESTIIELFECLPVIEHLKYFRFTQMSFHDGIGLTFLAVLIKSSPNLEKIELEIDTDFDMCDVIYDAVSVDDPDLIDDADSVDDPDLIDIPGMYEKYMSDVWLEHLKEMEIQWFSNLEPEMEFVKFILARSPKLKKVSITSSITIMRDKELESKMLNTLLHAPRASAVEINVV